MSVSTSPSPLREQLDHYVRALRERDDLPEERQDLGTFVMWLLRRLDYTIRLAPLHYQETSRKVSKGRYQGGIDLVASRPGDGNAEDLFLFVLKHGNFGRAEWKQPDGIIGDLNDLGDTDPTSHARWLPSDFELGRVVIVVCHNGEFDDETVAEQRRNRQRHIEERGFGFEWWSAVELVDIAQRVLGDGADDQLFPPTVRPFYGVVLDALATTKRIDHDAIERLLAARLPGKKPEVLRALTELSLFAAMLTAQPAAREATLDLLDALRAIVTRSAAALVAHQETGPRFREALTDLLATFVSAGGVLCELLAPLAEAPDGLATNGPGELIDWPLRAARITRDLTLTARISTDLVAYYRRLESRAKHDAARESARKHAARLEELHTCCLARCLSLTKHNIGGLGTPITDDLLIEYALLWRTLLDAGEQELVRQLIAELFTRWVLRRRLGYPGPALYQHARTPMRERDVRTLAEAWISGSLPPSFEDGGSTLLPVVVALAMCLDVEVDLASLQVFKVLRTESGTRGAVYPQSWIPPDDAGQRWYGEALSDEGVCHVHELDDPQRMVARLFELHGALPTSAMAELGFGSIDGLAWVQWRTRPPLRWLFDALPKPPPA